MAMEIMGLVVRVLDNVVIITGVVPFATSIEH